MILDNIKKIIEENPIALATLDKNKPNVIAVASVKLISKDSIIITDNYMKQTKDNLKNNPDVCLAVWNSQGEGYKLIGTAEYFESGKWLDYIKKIPENKGLSAKGAILIKINKIIGLC
jgi:predicted pyridoxine 5'-phosphate oxidase superfamily flavin-nucleotide-binding protein